MGGNLPNERMLGPASAFSVTLLVAQNIIAWVSLAGDNYMDLPSVDGECQC